MRRTCKTESPLNQGNSRFVSIDGETTGFTLVELLVVISIIALLAGMLLPALAKAKAKGQAISCTCNLRQLQTAYLTYTEDNNDALPPDISIQDGPMQMAAPGSWVLGNTQRDTRITNLQNGVLFRYANNPGSYLCPADRSGLVSRQVLLRTRSYSLNVWLNGDLTFSGGPFKYPTYPYIKGKYSQVANPAQVFAFIEEHEKSIDDGAMEVRGPEPGPDLDVWYDLPSDRHGRGCVLSFADGHVLRWRLRSPKVFSGHSQGAQPGGDLLDLRELKSWVPQNP